MRISCMGVVIGTAFSVAGCATVTRGTTDQVQIQSNPPGAVASTSMGYSCTTPCALSVPRKDEFSVVISKPGYQEQTVEVKTKVAGNGAAGFAGNILIGGLVGMGADAATGAALDHDPNPVVVELQPLEPRPVPSRPAPPRKPPTS